MAATPCWKPRAPGAWSGSSGRRVSATIPGSTSSRALCASRWWRPNAWTLKELLATNPTLLVALDSIMDPQNLGAILRSAEVAGCDGAILPEHRSAPLSPAAVKASSGATELLRIAKVSGMPSAIAEVKRAGLWCVALDHRGEIPAWDFDLTQRVCVVVGSEGEGVHRLVKERCDARVRLPVKGHIASLNASAAAAALLYEVLRQRTKALSPSGERSGEGLT
jgi:23S rRNA (guanosine2251-2'-O)-methyltransferase